MNVQEYRKCSAKTENDIEVAVKKLTKRIQEAAWAVTPTLDTN